MIFNDRKLKDRIERNSFAGTGGCIIGGGGGGGGGAKGMLAPLSNYWGGGLAPPRPPSSYAYDKRIDSALTLAHLHCELWELF